MARRHLLGPEGKVARDARTTALGSSSWWDQRKKVCPCKYKERVADISHRLVVENREDGVTRETVRECRELLDEISKEPPTPRNLDLKRAVEVLLLDFRPMKNESRKN